MENLYIIYLEDSFNVIQVISGTLQYVTISIDFETMGFHKKQKEHG